MNVTPALSAARLFFAIAAGRAPAAEVLLVDWNHSWDYMMPMGLDPALADPDFNATWFLKSADFEGYDGPLFGGFTTAGDAGVPSSFNRGSGPGPLGYDVIEYLAAGGPEVSAFGTHLNSPALGNRHTAYFRTTFTAPPNCLFPKIRMLADDGALVYLDGVLVASVNMEGNTEAYTAAAADAVATRNETGTPDLNNEACIQSFRLADAGAGTEADSFVYVPISALAAGEHTLAVSARSNSPTSTDLCMGLQLLGNDAGISASASNVRRHDNGPGVADDTFSFDVTVSAFNVPGASSWTSDSPAANGPASGSYAPASYTFAWPAQRSDGMLNGAAVTFRDATDATLAATVEVAAPALPAGPPVAWGRGNDGQLGDGTTVGSRVTPGAVDVSGVLAGKDLIAIAAGESHCVALSSEGRAYGWGYNFFGQMGIGTAVPRQPVPVAVHSGGALAGKTIVQIKAGLHHCLALSTEGKVYAWGHNDSWALGDGTFTQRNTPIAVNMSGALAGKSVKAIAAGYLHNVVLTTDGRLFAWGENSSGQLGDGTFTSRSAPVAVVMTGALSGRTVAGIAAGREHSLAVTSDGRVFAWGLNGSGQLGDGTQTNRNAPTAVSVAGALAGKIVTAVDAGYAQTLALASAGELLTWGSNAKGQLGDGTTTNRLLPGAVSMNGALAGKTPVLVAAGRDHCLALSSDGRVYGWGDNAYGQLGDGTTAMRSSPVAVHPDGAPAGRVVRSLDAGTGLSIALTVPSALERWRHSHFGSVAPVGTGGDDADPDKDGIGNLTEFAFGMDPHLPDPSALPSWQRSGGNYVLSFASPGGVSGITYVAEYNSRLAAEGWSPLPNFGDAPIFTFAAPADLAPRLFLRLRVTAP
jgi:alpha-tubulin suppressor-like RCC1 family protein